MNSYVRLGMHFLYYRREQEKALYWQTVLKLLQAEGEKVGKQYDSAASKSHIMPFIQYFELQDGLNGLVELGPSRYPCFNAFFSREIKEDARPIAEPDNDNVTSCPADCRLNSHRAVSERRGEAG